MFRLMLIIIFGPATDLRAPDRMFFKLAINFVVLLFIGNFTIPTAADPSNEDSCDAEDATMANLLSHIFQCLNANQNLSQHIMQLNDRIDHLQMKLQETEMKLEKHISEAEATLHYMPTDHIVIQRRQDGSVDFYREWAAYKEGFGSSMAEFFIGLQQLHKLTNSRPYALIIVMEDWENDRRYAKYDRFVIGSESEKYMLKELGEYSGTAGDSLSIHRNQKFSTKDQENDRNEREHCAVWYTGAWWYNACHESNLNGRYLKGNVTRKEIAKGIHWKSFRGQEYSLKFVEMSLYPV